MRHFVGFALTNGTAVCRSRRCAPQGTAMIAKPLRMVEASGKTCYACGAELAPPQSFLLTPRTIMIGVPKP